MSYEIERKWVLKKLPKECKHIPPIIVEQCYFSSGPAVRIRKYSGETISYRITFKGKGGIKRIEIEDDISEETYNKLKEFMVNPKGIVNKLFWKIPIKGADLSYEISVVDNLWNYIEVEFKSEEDANNFSPPDWFGEELTDVISIKSYSEIKTKLGSFNLPKVLLSNK